jgi:hypothetical protein
MAKKGCQHNFTGRGAVISSVPLKMTNLMKNLALAFCLLICAIARAQDYDTYSSKVKIGGGYAHDFPGLNGYSVFAEYARPLSAQLQGAVGMKLTNMSGYPRTSQVQEYTRSASIDFNLYYVPLSTPAGELRIGAGYSFSFYNIRRSFPVISNHATGEITAWPTQDKKGRASGVSLTGEYEYFIPETNYSIGLRASLFKAYDHVTFAGVFGAIQF